MTMKKNVLKRLLSCVAMATCVLTAHAADRLLIVGEAVWGGWSIDNSVVMLNNESEPDVFKATVQLKETGTFKFLTTTDWGNLEYRAGDNDVTLSEGEAAALVSTDENSNDKQFRVSQTANYDIVCDLAAKTIVVTKSAYQTNAVNHTALWMVGSATPGGWSIGDGVMLTADASNPVVFKATADLVEGELKFAVNKHTGWGQTFYLRDVTDEHKMVFGGDDNKWNIQQAGTYDIIVDVVGMTISIAEHTASGIDAAQVAPVGHTEYYGLNGMRLTAPQAGQVCLKKEGKRVVKVLR